MTREEVFANISKRSAAGASPAGERREPHEAVQGTDEKKFETGEKKCLTKAVKCGNLIKLSARAAASH